MQDYFYSLADDLQDLLIADEVFTGAFRGEDSDFVRLNHGRIRQAGSVRDCVLSIDLISGRRHTAADISLSGDRELDRARLTRLVTSLRDQRSATPEDPYLLYATEVQSTERPGTNQLPDSTVALEAIQAATGERDLVGIYSSGGVHAGFANSLGQRNWQSTYTFNLDWSLYHTGDKAVKSMYAGFTWDDAAFEQKMAWANEQLGALRHAPRTIDPGHYRVYLTPAALLELLELVGRNGFGLKAQRTKQSTLIRMLEQDAELSPLLSLAENTADGVAPNFQESGFLRPEHVPLISAGRLGECLISPRSAQEFGVATNGASAFEQPESFDVTAGALAETRVLTELGTGIYVGNLWYLNYSDRNACRATGMTRFATFWVVDGRIQAPLNVMRFDETIYRALGDNLEALTAEREMLLDPGTYFGRSTGSARLPGALINDYAFTL